MKSIVPVLFLSIIVTAAVAQQPVVISIGAGISNTSSSVKEKNYLGNGYDVQGNVFVPFTGKADGKFALGVLAGGTYYTSGSLTPDISKLQALYKLYNGNLAISNNQIGGATSKGLMGTIGLQASLTLNHFVLSPSVSGGYFSLKQHGFAAQSSVMVNGAKQTITLLDLDETRQTGFVVIPKLKIGYSFTKTFGVYTSAAFNMGPKLSSAQRKLEPQGGFNDKNTYEPSQLSSGKMISQPVSAAYQTLMLNIGVNWSVGRKTKKPSTMPSRLSMTPTTARQTQGATFGEKVNQGMQPAAAEKSTNPLYEDKGTATTNPLAGASLAKPGSPIGGIVVKGGKNPGGNLLVVTSNDSGEFGLNGLEVGNYQFTLTAPEELQSKGIGTQSTSGGSGAASASYARQGGRTYTGGRKNEPQEKSINEKGVKRSEAAEAARPGSPIGGIVVKGGKNPGGNMTNLSVGEDGTIQFDVLEAGDYKFIIQTAEETKNKPKEKVKEKATSGLKDTLKTNV